MSIHETFPLNFRSDLPLLSRSHYQNQEFCLYKETPLTYTMQLFPKAHRLTWLENAHEEANTILQLGESDLVQWRTQGRLLVTGQRGMKSLMPCVWGFTAHAIPSGAVPQHSMGVYAWAAMPPMAPALPALPTSQQQPPALCEPHRRGSAAILQITSRYYRDFCHLWQRKLQFLRIILFFHSAKQFKVPHLTCVLFHM